MPLSNCLPNALNNRVCRRGADRGHSGREGRRTRRPGAGRAPFQRRRRLRPPCPHATAGACCHVQQGEPRRRRQRLQGHLFRGPSPRADGSNTHSPPLQHRTGGAMQDRINTLCQRRSSAPRERVLYAHEPESAPRPRVVEEVGVAAHEAGDEGPAPEVENARGGPEGGSRATAVSPVAPGAPRRGPGGAPSRPAATSAAPCGTPPPPGP